ncbi:MAG: M23 family metallopeptidase [Deltaproteobacteria bacterium]|nr:M23 family metallopeptidase [Deltaproteobacteria bacterium]
MSDKLHIILTGEQDSTRTFALPKSVLKTSLLVSFVVIVLLLISSIAGINFARENSGMESSLTRISGELAASKLWNAEFKERLTREVSARESRLQNRLTRLIKQNDAKEVMLNKAMAGLKSRSKTIDSILRAVGVKIKVKSNAKNSGGPFIPLVGNTYENLTFKVDSYLDALQATPLGPPVWGTITSKYGPRIDPINHKPAFHAGLDIRQKVGTHIMSTADGVVQVQGFSRFNGNYVVINHGQGFKTMYLHMEKTLVKKGQKVKRGQTIGLLGNTGRSTGAHVHYEIIYKGRTVNPLRFVRIAQYVRKRKGRS